MKEIAKIVTIQTLWQTLARLVTGLSSIVLTAVLTRNLGVENYGDFTKILALVSIFYLPTDFGLNALFIKFATVSKDLNQLFSNLAAIRGILALFWFGASFFASFVLFGSNNLALSLASATILTTAATTTASGFFQFKLAYQWLFLGNLVSAATTLFLIWQFLPNLNLVVIFGALLAGQILAVCVNFAKVFSDLKFVFKKIKSHLIRDYIWQGLPLGLTLIFNLIAFKADLIILSALKTSTSVGFYGLAVRIFEWVIIPPAFILNAAFPILAKTYFENFGQFLKISKNLGLVLTGFGVLVFLVLFFVAGPLTGLVGGQDFVAGSAALKVLAIGTPLFYLTGLLMWLLVILEKKRELVLIYGFGAVVNIILNLIFIPRFDFQAAAVTTVFSEGLILLLGVVFLLKFVRQTK